MFVPFNTTQLLPRIIGELVGAGTAFESLLRSEITSSVQNFVKSAKEDYHKIKKSDSFGDVKQFFEDNKRKLKKSEKGYSNIPEDGDCSILKGLIDFETDGNKFLVSEDEHFWRYKDPILNNFQINVIEEWNCHFIIP